MYIISNVLSIVHILLAPLDGSNEFISIEDYSAWSGRVWQSHGSCSGGGGPEGLLV